MYEQEAAQGFNQFSPMMGGRSPISIKQQIQSQKQARKQQ
jgi:hypothetical protein